MKYIQPKPTRSPFITGNSLWQEQQLCWHCGKHISEQREDYRDHHMARKPSQQYTWDNFHLYDIHWTVCMCHCDTEYWSDGGSATSADDWYNVDHDEEPDEWADGVADDEGTVPLQRLLSWELLQEPAEPIYEAESQSTLSGGSPPASICSCGTNEDCHLLETPPWDTISLASDSSYGSASSTFSRRSVDSAISTATEDDSRICFRRTLDLETMEDWSVDGDGNLWPNVILRLADVILVD